MTAVERQCDGFLACADVCAINLDDKESVALVHRAKAAVTFAIDVPAMVQVEPGSIIECPTGISATVLSNGEVHALNLKVPGRHNLMNALAAIAGARATGMRAGTSIAALASFTGLARRFDIVGTSARGVTVIDDFGHNPEKVAATLSTMKAHQGRVIAFFQPHGYGPLRQMGTELAEVLGTRLGARDRVILCDPVYFGGTVDRTQGSERIVELVRLAADRGAPDTGPIAEYIAAREDCADRIVELARPGDRVVIMGARDDTLSAFAAGLLARLP